MYVYIYICVTYLGKVSMHMLSLNAEVDTTGLAPIRTHSSFHRNEPYYAKVPGFNYLPAMSHNSLQADNLDREVEHRQTDRF